MYSRDGEHLVGRDENGHHVNKIHLTDLSFDMGAAKFPTLRLDLELIGYEVELDVKEEDIVAFLNRKGIRKIEGRKAETDADLHTDA